MLDAGTCRFLSYLLWYITLPFVIISLIILAWIIYIHLKKEYEKVWVFRKFITKCSIPIICVLILGDAQLMFQFCYWSSYTGQSHIFLYFFLSLGTSIIVFSLILLLFKRRVLNKFREGEKEFSSDYLNLWAYIAGPLAIGFFPVIMIFVIHQLIDYEAVRESWGLLLSHCWFAIDFALAIFLIMLLILIFTWEMKYSEKMWLKFKTIKRGELTFTIFIEEKESLGNTS